LKDYLWDCIQKNDNVQHWFSFVVVDLLVCWFVFKTFALSCSAETLN